MPIKHVLTVTRTIIFIKQPITVEVNTSLNTIEVVLQTIFLASHDWCRKPSQPITWLTLTNWTQLQPTTQKP